MASQPVTASPLRVLEEELGMDVTAAKDTAEVSAEGAYYLEQVSITETSEDDYEYEEIPDDNFSIPEGEEDLSKAMQMVQERTADTQILEQKTVLPSKQAVPEVIEDFLCNFLIKMGMTRTLDCFQSEWYELVQKEVARLGALGNVPDVYTQNMLLESENKSLKTDLKHYKQAAELKLHYASYEPTIRVLHEKHNTLLKQKMLTSLERDKAVGQISVLQATLRHMEIGHSYHAPHVKVSSKCERGNASEGPTQRSLREAKEQSKYKAKMKENIKDSEFPSDMQPDQNLYLCNENISPAKFDYKLNDIFRIHELPVSCIAVHPHKEVLITCGEDHLWKIVELSKGNVLFTGFGHTDWLSDCCLDNSGSKMATSSGDSTIKLWDLFKGNCILTFEGHNHAVWSCTWHSCGDFVASSSLDTTSKIWDINSERCRCTFYGHTDSVNTIEFFPYSNILLTGSADKTLSIWDARTGKCEQSLYGHMHSINDATFNPKGHIIASCDACGVTKLWDFRKLLPIVSIDVGPSPGNEVNFNSSGQVLAQASGSGVIHLLDLKSGQIYKLMGQESEVNTVVFSHNGESLFSGGSDGTVRTWS
ncbi:sperm-associated antigen 16 protein isoform X2 [Erinaceus europaeus]|uniref:Sperm-associated antigen 16 protein isoform X2 n=1 Tax=Erinaceus europaeus TaxID=9365 RepID=A0ABM3XM95_ERIEU|nr:sperm-associated antigen 16 protein isoform X2 [Erinaceus europaeus]